VDGLKDDDVRNKTLARDPIVGHVHNYGYFRLNWNGPDSERKTLVVAALDGGDGGAIAINVLRHLGIPTFFFPVGSSSLSGAANFAASAKKLSSDHLVWAARVLFRRPALQAIQRVATNPHFLLIGEDPAAIALGLEATKQCPQGDALSEAARSVAELAFFAAETKRPALFISLQKAREFAEANIDALIAFSGISAPPEARLAAITAIDQGTKGLHGPAVGRPSPKGGLNRVQKRGMIMGWAKMPLESARVRVRALIDGVEVASALADELREDLLVHNIGDGHHGFSLNVARHLSDNPIPIEVVAGPDDTLLGVAEMTRAGGKAVI
jgi:hypothetical protein